MAVTNTDSVVEIAQAIMALLDDPALELEDVFYGDQTLLPRLPAACVEIGSKTRDIQGVNLMTLNTFTVYIMVYHGRVADAQVTKLQCDQKAEQIEAALHQDVRFGDLIINGFVQEIDPGYAMRNNSLYYTTRMTWQGLTKTHLITRETA